MESKNKTKQKTKFIDAETRLVVARGGAGAAKMGEGGQKVQTSSLK